MPPPDKHIILAQIQSTNRSQRLVFAIVLCRYRLTVLRKGGFASITPVTGWYRLCICNHVIIIIVIRRKILINCACFINRNTNICSATDWWRRIKKSTRIALEFTLYIYIFYGRENGGRIVAKYLCYSNIGWDTFSANVKQTSAINIDIWLCTFCWFRPRSLAIAFHFRRITVNYYS